MALKATTNPATGRRIASPQETSPRELERIWVGRRLQPMEEADVRPALKLMRSVATVLRQRATELARLATDEWASPQRSACR